MMTHLQYKCQQVGMLCQSLCLIFRVLQVHSHRRVDKGTGNFHNFLLKLWQVHVEMFVMLPVRNIHSFLTRSGVPKEDIGFSKLHLVICKPALLVEILTMPKQLSCNSSVSLKKLRLQESYNWL